MSEELLAGTSASCPQDLGYVAATNLIQMGKYRLKTPLPPCTVAYSSVIVRAFTGRGEGGEEGGRKRVERERERERGGEEGTVRQCP